MSLPASHNFLLPQYQAALGTVVHATPLVEAIRQTLPTARIVVTSSGLAAQVWEGNQHLEAVLHTPNPLHDLIGAVQAVRGARPFGRERYTTLLTTGNERTRITLAALLAGRSRRIGFAVHGALVHHHLRFEPALSQIENNLRLVSAAGLTLADHLGTEPRLYPVQGVGYADQLLASIGHPRIVLATQTSPTQRKSWPQQRWIELAHALRERYRAELLFVGTSSEAGAIEEIRSRIGFPTTSIAGQTNIQQLAAVLCQCDLGIMLDTGPLHVARSVGLPAVTIAPAWSPEHEWLPVGHPRYRILKNADFPPPAPDDYVITEVSVSDVLAATDDLFATAGPTAAAMDRTPGS